jgi:hypothetical protein
MPDKVTWSDFEGACIDLDIEPDPKVIAGYTKAQYVAAYRAMRAPATGALALPSLSCGIRWCSCRGGCGPGCSAAEPGVIGNHDGSSFSRLAPPL